MNIIITIIILLLLLILILLLFNKSSNIMLFCDIDFVFNWLRCYVL